MTKAQFWRSLAGTFLLAIAAGAMAAEPIILLPNSFRAYQLDAAGSLELRPDWTESARTNLHTGMSEVLSEWPDYDYREIPDLSEEQLAIIDEHIALFEANAAAAVEMIQFARIKAIKESPRYTVGPGLAFLAEQGIADKAVVITGGQSWSTGGRIFMSILVGAATGYIPAGGASGLLIGHIDLRSGDIVWMNNMQPISGGDVRKADRVRGALRNVTVAYPKGRLYTLTTLEDEG